MAALAFFFFRFVFADWVPAADAEEYIAGMILLGVAPCTAMVFVWSRLTNGNPNYTLAQVSINNLILVFAFAPVAGLLLGVTDLTVPWGTLVASVVIFVVVPLGAGLITRWWLLRSGRPNGVETLANRLKTTSVVGLLLTVVLLFGFQAETIVEQPARVLMIAVLIEVPVMLSLVSFANRTKGWFPTQAVHQSCNSTKSNTRRPQAPRFATIHNSGNETLQISTSSTKGAIGRSPHRRKPASVAAAALCGFSAVGAKPSSSTSMKSTHRASSVVMTSTARSRSSISRRCRSVPASPWVIGPTLHRLPSTVSIIDVGIDQLEQWGVDT